MTDLPFPIPATAKSAILGYAIPVLARLVLADDALQRGDDVLAIRSTLLRPGVQFDDEDPFAEAGAPSTDSGRILAQVTSASIEHLTAWTVDELVSATGMDEAEAKAEVGNHLLFHVTASITADEIRHLNRQSDDDDEPTLRETTA